MRPLPYRLLPHTADIRIRVRGRSLRTLFQNAVFALTDQLVEARRIKSRRSRRLRVRAQDVETLLVRLLQEVLYLFDARRFVARRLEIESWKDKRLIGRVWGETFDPERHGFKTEIKAVTYHGLKISKSKGRWYAELVLDV